MKKVLISFLTVLTAFVLLSGCELNIHLPAKTDGTTTTAPAETAKMPQTTQPVTEADTTAAPQVTEKTTKNDNYTKFVESPSSTSKVAVSKDEAKAIVLNHAGLSEADVRWYKTEIDRERGELVYEIEFDYGRYEYEYEVSAEDGRILKSEKDFKD